MEPQVNQPEDTDNTTNKNNTEEHNKDHKNLLRPKADNTTNKNNTEEHNKDHKNLLRPKAGILIQARRRPPNTGLSHTTGL
jgi:hypothetical protein